MSIETCKSELFFGLVSLEIAHTTMHSSNKKCIVVAIDTLSIGLNKQYNKWNLKAHNELKWLQNRFERHGC